MPHFTPQSLTPPTPCSPTLGRGRPRWRRLVLLLLLSASSAACRPPRAPSPVKVLGPGPVRLLERLKLSLWNRTPDVLNLFTPRCWSGCRGFVPRPVMVGGGYSGARWVPAPAGRLLMTSLAHLRLSHKTIDRFDLSPLRVRVFHSQVHIRARLFIRGAMAQGHPRVDQGVVDMVLVSGDGGQWKVDGFRLARLHSLWREDPGFHVAQRGAWPTSETAKSLDHPLPGRETLPPTAALDTDGDGRAEVVWGGRKVYAQHPAKGLKRWRLLLTPPGGALVRTLVAGDVDGDGRADLFVGTFGGTSGIWLNRPSGFVPLPGLKISGHVTGALLADLDGDQDLDLYVTRHGPASRQPWQPGEPNLLFIKTPSGYQQRQTPAAGAGWSLAVCGGDFDGDGDVDLFVANELGPSRLWQNRGAARFGDAAHRAGLEIQMATSCAVGDANGDGRLDLLVGGRGSALRYLLGRPGAGVPGSRLLGRRRDQVRSMMAGATLWLNSPGTGRRGLRFRPTVLPKHRWWTVWAGMMDHDLDGHLDLLLLDGGPSNPNRWWWETLGPVLNRRAPALTPGGSGSGSAALLIRPRAGPWLDVAPLSLTSRGHCAVATPARAANGRVHLFLAGVIRNDWRGGKLEEDEHAVLLRLQARSINRDAMGSRVEALAGGRRQVRVVGLAPGMPGPPGFVHFGVGAALRVEQLSVRWPDGTVERHHDLPVDRVVQIRQGKAPLWNDPDDGDADGGDEPEGTDVGTSGVGEVGGSEGSGAGSKDGPLSAPLNLTVKIRGGVQPLSALAGKRATLVLITAGGLQGRARCDKLKALGRKKGVRLVQVRLSPGASNKACLSSYPATPGTMAALQDRRGLLPLLAVVDASGRVFRLLSGEPNPTWAEAALLDLLE